MTNPWFKFYAGEYLSDLKILQLNAQERSCWVTLLCLANQSDGGEVKFLNQDQLLILSGVQGLLPNVLEKFEKLGLVTLSNEIVTVKNWEKRQYSEGYSRVKEFRKRKSNVKDNDREEKRREEKRREEKIEHSISYLEKIPDTDLKELVTRFDASEKGIKSKAEDLLNYCKSKGRKYKNYKSFLLNALKKDFPERKKTFSQIPEFKKKAELPKGTFAKFRPEFMKK